MEHSNYVFSQYYEDPSKATNYNRSVFELERFLCFCVMVPGKSAYRVASILANICEEHYYNRHRPNMRRTKKLSYEDSDPTTIYPITDIIWRLLYDDTLAKVLEQHKTGCYTRLNRCFAELVKGHIYHRELETVSVDRLESVYGIGPKTARYFILHSRPDQQLAVLDTHILKYLKSLEYDVPKSTPAGKKYKKIEEIFLKEAQKLGKSPAELDLEIWNRYARKVDTT